jgi:hypothetical protein
MFVFLLLCTSPAVYELSHFYGLSVVFSVVLTVAYPFAAYAICQFIYWQCDNASSRKYHRLRLEELEFPKCTRLDELVHAIDARSIRDYINSLPTDKRKVFFRVLGYHTGEWCMKWYNTDPIIDRYTTTNNPIRLKLIAQYIPRDQFACKLK